MSGLLPTVADAGDVIGFLVMVAFVIIAVLGQIMAKFREAQQRGPRPGRPPEAAKPAKPLEDEIRRFLRGAMDRQQGGGRRAGQAGRPEAPPARPPRPAEKPVEAELVAPELGGLRERLEAEKPRRLVSDLGEEVAQADDKMAGRLHEVFEHKLGSLEGTPGNAVQPPRLVEAESPEDQISPLPSTAAAGLAAMFADAESIRRAVLIHEVLQRPEHRWS